MDKIVIEGGRRLAGSVRINGAKNSALPNYGKIGRRVSILEFRP